MNTVTVNGVKIYPFESSEQLVDYVAENPSMLIALNAGKLDRSTPEMKEMINNNIGYCDGRAAIVALQQKGFKRPVIAGCELWLKIIERFKNERSVYLVGGKQEVIDNVIEKLRDDYPDINIAGYRNGYIKTQDERSALIEDIKAKQPGIVFVAMGSPAQENLMIEMSKVNPNAIYQGLGGSFDVYTGRVKRAPMWTRKLHIEGPYRAFTRFTDKNIRKRFFLDLKFYIKLKLRLVK